MTPANDFTHGAEAMLLVAIDTLKQVLYDNIGDEDNPLVRNILSDFADELNGRL